MWSPFSREMPNLHDEGNIGYCSRNESDIEDLGYRILVPIECLTGITLNLFSVVIFNRLLQQKSVLSYRIYKYIAITDILYLMIVAPLGLIRCHHCADSSLLHKIMVHYEIYVYLPWNSTLFKTSAYLIVLLSLERYCAVAWALKYRHNIYTINRLFAPIFIAVLCICGLLSVYRAFLYYIGPAPCFRLIETNFGSSEFPFLYGILASIPIYIIPNAAILIFSGLLIRFLRRRRTPSQYNGMIRFEIKRSSVTIPVTYITSHSMLEAQRRLSMLTVTVCFTYFICTVNEFFYLLRVPHVFFPGDEGRRSIDLILFYGNLIEFMKPTINFLLWITYDRNIQNEIRKIFKCG